MGVDLGRWRGGGIWEKLREAEEGKAIHYIRILYLYYIFNKNKAEKNLFLNVCITHLS